MRFAAHGRLKVRPRVLIADNDTPFARRLSDYLWDHGLECRVVETICEAQEAVEFWQPDAVFVDLMLPETNALSLCKFIQKKDLKKVPKIVVMSKHALPHGIETMRKAGASCYLVKPFAFEEAIEILVPDPSGSGNAGGTIKELHLLNLFLKQAVAGGADQMSMFNLMKMIGMNVHALRCSVIKYVNADMGLVMASNDDETVQGLPLQLAQYPEVREVRRTQKPLIITNIATSDLLAPVQSKLKNTPYETMAVFPVFWRGQFYGAMSLRMEQKDKVEIFYIEKFGQACSHIISLAIGTAAP